MITHQGGEESLVLQWSLIVCPGWAPTIRKLPAMKNIAMAIAFDRLGGVCVIFAVGVTVAAVLYAAGRRSGS